MVMSWTLNMFDEMLPKECYGNIHVLSYIVYLVKHSAKFRGTKT
uniref:Uncharacterized protein n=1 Tax=Arundo donax TaxID=35708 RepID=A0A0A9B2T3_ARUDO